MRSRRISKKGGTPSEADSLAFLTGKISRFASERDWGKFHNPKNLAMSAAIEAGELMEEFQWHGPAESLRRARGPQKGSVSDELADVAIMILRLAEVCRIDLGRAILAKMEKNAVKYPVELVRGKPHKYTYYLAKQAAKKGASK